MPLWYMDCFELKANSRKLLPIPALNYLEEFELGALPLIRDCKR